jgi:hypothetical protein
MKTVGKQKIESHMSSLTMLKTDMLLSLSLANTPALVSGDPKKMVI